MISMTKLAELCGYSRVTVSAALKGQPGVSEKVRQHILKIADEHNYTPNKMAASLRGEPSYLIGMMVRDITNPFYSEMIKVIDEVVSEAGFSLLLLNTNENLEREAKAIKTFYSYYIDGLLLSPFIHNDNSYKILDDFYDKKIPVIMLDKLPNESKAGFIGFNNYQGAYDATNHLIQQGHTKISYLAGPDISISSQEREDGFKQCLIDNNIEFNESNIIACGSSSESGYTSALATLNNGKRPTAFLCFNDLVAIGVYNAAQELELKIPDDLSIIGFDNIQLTNILAPPLTTVSLNISSVARDAAKNLVRCIKEKQPSIDYKKEYNLDLVIRKSVKPPKK